MAEWSSPTALDTGDEPHPTCFSDTSPQTPWEEILAGESIPTLITGDMESKLKIPKIQEMKKPQNPESICEFQRRYIFYLKEKIATLTARMTQQTIDSEEAMKKYEELKAECKNEIEKKQIRQRKRNLNKKKNKRLKYQLSGNNPDQPDSNKHQTASQPPLHPPVGPQHETCLRYLTSTP